MKKSPTAVGCFALLLSLPVVIVLSIFINGYVTSQLWEWFLMPLGVPAITILQASGLTLLFRTFSPEEWESKPSNKSDTVDEHPLATAFVKMFGFVILKPAFTWFFGWVIFYYMHHPIPFVH